jgi:hypothetical protein
MSQKLYPFKRRKFSNPNYYEIVKYEDLVGERKMCTMLHDKRQADRQKLTSNICEMYISLTKDLFSYISAHNLVLMFLQKNSSHELISVT